MLSPIYEKPEAKQTYSMVLTLYCALMCLVALGVAMFAKEGLMLLTTKEYYGAYLAAGVLAFNGIIYGMAYIAIMGCSIHKDNKPLAVSVLFAAGITAILYFLLVPIWGIVGAALSTALGYIVVPIYLFYKSQKYWYIPYKFKIAISIFLFSICLYALSLSIYTSSILINISLKSLLVCAYLIFLILIFKYQYSDEYEKVKHKLLPSKK
ncbi:MAG: polysaccharide biosynthesis C-terminal domain-containing protein [Bacteroidetes bacterium]|nr:polysaccharide biosynthesis C-terminal domain-containing protein [Bacteroidota bacterium]